MMFALLAPLLSVWEGSREIVMGDFDVETSPAGNAVPTHFSVAYSPAEISAVFDDGEQAEQ